MVHLSALLFVAAAAAVVNASREQSFQMMAAESAESGVATAPKPERSRERRGKWFIFSKRLRTSITRACCRIVCCEDIAAFYWAVVGILTSADSRNVRLLTFSPPLSPSADVCSATQAEATTIPTPNKAYVNGLAAYMDIVTTFEHEDAQKNSNGNHNQKRCAAAKGYTGFSLDDAVGSIAFTASENGIATFKYGNCWDAGKARLYINGVKKDEASARKVDELYKFAFVKGDVIELKDEDGCVVCYTLLHCSTAPLHSQLA